MADMDTNNSPTAPRKRKERSDKGQRRTKVATIIRRDLAYRSKALDEIDERLAKCIAERAQVLETLSRMAYWQDKFTRLGQEIENLLGYQSKLIGKPAAWPDIPKTVVNPLEHLPGLPDQPDPGTYSAFAPLPPGAGSIPAKQIKISPSVNVGEMVKAEGGFS